MKKHSNIHKSLPGIFLFLLLMGGCARKVSLGIADLECHDRPFLVGENT
jgi:hypothetical protein